MAEFTHDLLDLAQIRDDYNRLTEDRAMVECDPAGLLALTIEPELDLINGCDFERFSSFIAELKRAQDALCQGGVRVLLSNAF